MTLQNSVQQEMISAVAVRAESRSRVVLHIDNQYSNEDGTWSETLPRAVAFNAP
jgi:hypothetical protein